MLYAILGFPGSDSEECTYNAGDPGSIPGLENEILMWIYHEKKNLYLHHGSSLVQTWQPSS